MSDFMRIDWLLDDSHKHADYNGIAWMIWCNCECNPRNRQADCLIHADFVPSYQRMEKYYG